VCAGYGALMRWGIVVVLGSLAFAAPAQARVTAAVGGVRDPAAGQLDLWVQASERDGAGLRAARVVLDGQQLDEGFFDEPGCTAGECPQVGGVALIVPTTAVSDGERRLEVIVEDGAGVAEHVLDRSITVTNTPIPWTSTVTVGIGSGATEPDPPGGGGGGGGGGGPTPPGGTTGCVAPQLSAFLAQRPLRFRRTVPVLAGGRKYRFEGRLTCRINGRRRSAPHGTKVELRHVRRGRTVDRVTLRVRSRGEIVAPVRLRRSRTLVFRFEAEGVRPVQVRIPVRVVRVKR
jgi:hypothetical protein